MSFDPSVSSWSLCAGFAAWFLIELFRSSNPNRSTAVKVWMWIAFVIHIAVLYDKAHVLTNPSHAPGVQFLMVASPTVIAALIVAVSRARRAEAALTPEHPIETYRAMAAKEAPTPGEARIGRLRAWVGRLDEPAQVPRNWYRA